MKKKIAKMAVFIMMLCLLHVMAYGNTIALYYDGENHVYDDMPISLYVDGKAVETSQMRPIQFNGYTLVPAREVFEETGALVLWKSSEQKVYVDNGASLIVLEVNNSTGWVNGSEVRLDMPAKVINGKVMIPTRFVGETLGYQVVWDATMRSININTKAAAGTMTEAVTDGGIGINADVTTGIDLGTNNEAGSGNAASQDNWLNQSCISYSSSDEALTLTGIQGLSTAMINVDEQYHEKKVVINLGMDCSSQLSQGTWTKSSGEISAVEIRNDIFGTQIVLTTKTIQAVKMYEINGSIVLQCVKPSEKYGRIVVVDAGHGYQDPGTTYEGIKEKDLTLQYALALQKALQQRPDIKVYLTREDDTFLELKERTEMANEIGPDLFISLHVNSAGNVAASGIETYYTEKADTRNKAFASIVQNALVSTFDKRDRGVKSNTFIVTRYTNAPAILVEIGFITNTEDRAMITANGFADEYGQVLYQCILQYYDQGLNYIK